MRTDTGPVPLPLPGCPPPRAVTALALRAERADPVEFGWSSAPVPFRAGEAVLDGLERFGDLGGTPTTKAVRAHDDGHDRVLIVTDEQAAPDTRRGGPAEPVPADVPVHTWNLAGYQPAHGPAGPHRHTFGGLTDAAFTLVPLIEAGRAAGRPRTTGPV